MPPVFKYVCATVHINESDHYWHPHFINWNDEVRYVVGQLEVTGQNNLHWQLYLECGRPSGMELWKSWMMCDWAHLERRRGTREQAVKYCQKEESRVHGPETDFLHATDQQPSLTALNSPYRKALEARTQEEAMEIVKNYAPRDFVIYNTVINATMRKLFTEQPVFQQGLTFNIPMLDAELLSTRAIVLTGTSGVGKTQYALAHFRKPLLLSHIDQLKELKKDHDGIVFDDMTFRHWPPQSCIHLLDLELPRAINVKYGIATLPSKLPRFFTSNRDFRGMFSEHADVAEWAAIERRIHSMEIYEQLF